ncbi:AMP-binding protein [Nakamurella sp. UYEF19]|uniref:AMP-binding enzyme n=1 Tax=Nakamurella sp. UYEF19 TaxID=1756392 RepID=UPI003394AD48
MVHDQAVRLGGRGGRVAISVAGRRVTYAELESLIDQQHIPGSGLLDTAGFDVVDTLVAVFSAAQHGFAVLVRDSEAPSPLIDGLDRGLPAGTFLVAMTSGSAAAPRAILRTAASWSSSFEPLSRLTGLTDADTLLLTGPLHSTLHLFGAVHALWLGAHLTDESTEATAAHVVPAALDRLLDERSPMLRMVVVAGAALPPSLESRAAAAGLRLVEYYGAAELSFVAARISPAPLTAFPGVRVEIRRHELWAASPYLCLDRIGGPPLRGSADGFRTVGDLASIADDGRIEVHGRGDAAVTTGGHTVVVEDVEAALAALPGVHEAAVVGIPHDRLGQVVAAAVILDAGTDLAAVRRAARTALNGPGLPRVWRVVTALPRTGNGKIARGRLAADLAVPSRSVR